MAINKKLIHFKNKEAFDRELQAGNIMDTSICWIPDAKFIYTRGTYWYCSSKSDAEIQQLISDIETQLSNKVDKVEGKGLSTNDFTDDLLNLLKKVSKPLNYKGSVPTYNDLPTEGNLEGDVWNVTKTDVNYAWTGADWDPFGSSAVNIVDDLTTGGTSAALSAEQGKVLKGLVDAKADKVTSEHLESVISSMPENLVSGVSIVNKNSRNIIIQCKYSSLDKQGHYVEQPEGSVLPLTPATVREAGLMSAEDKNLFESLPDTFVTTSGNVEISDSEVTLTHAGAKLDPETGVYVKGSRYIMGTIPAVTEGKAGVMTAQDKVNLDKTLPNAISAEESRAMQAEAENLAVIKAETERAKAAEDEIRLSAGGDIVADSGDIPIMPLYRQANVLYTKVAENIKDTATMAIYVNSYNKPYIGKPFNRIKMMLGTPGRCRISIVNEHIFDANPTEEQSVVKDLVNVMCTSTGYHYWDLDEDVVVEEGQFVGAWYTADCSRYTYNNDLTYLTAYPSGWIGRTNLLKAIPKEEWTRYSAGYLNIGLYKRGSGSDFEWGKIDETASSNTSPTNMYVPMGQEKLIGKSIYKLRLNVSTIGYLTINLVNKAGTTQASIAKSWKLYIRQLGVQTIRLPEDIVLEEGQGIGFYAEGDTCIFKFGGSDFGTAYTLHGFYNYNEFNLSTMSTSANSRLNVGFIERGGKLSPLEDRTISIQGDSITTFAGTITDGNAAYYSVNHKYVNTIDATWWGLLVNECRMRLIRNDAWSGSRISGSGANAMNNTARCAALKNIDSKVDTYQFGAPEIIVIMAGTNDVSGNVALGEIGSTDVTNYIGAFTMMLRNIKTQCRNSKIVVFQLYRGNNYDYTNTGGTHQYEYQEAMEKVCKIYGAHYVGPEHFGISYPNTNYFTCDNSMSEYGPPTYTSADYLHPNMQGMERVYAGVRAYLESLY
jgi:lysophospholipase L1-like esterase